MSAFEVRFAQNDKEREAVYRLRYEVFNLELQEGLKESHDTQKDVEKYDECCLHLIAIDKSSRDIIGTYRIQDRKTASQNHGFCMAKLFGVAELEQNVLDLGLELSRACIHKNYRRGSVLYLLWKALTEYMLRNNKRFLFGSCSFPGTDPEYASKIYSYIRDYKYLHEKYSIPVKMDHKLPLLRYHPDFLPDELPPIFRAYMRTGARVCSEPALDFAFNSFDFATILDLREAEEKLLRKCSPKNSTLPQLL